jgi:hypothetical protein
VKTAVKTGKFDQNADGRRPCIFDFFRYIVTSALFSVAPYTCLKLF